MPLDGSDQAMLERIFADVCYAIADLNKTMLSIKETLESINIEISQKSTGA